MSQAKETDEDFVIHEDETEESVEETEAPETEEVDETEQETGEEEESEQEDGEVEIVLEGEEEPTSTPAKPSRFARRIGKLKGEVKEVNSELEEARQENEYLRERAKLLQQQIEERASEKAPDPKDFETDKEYEAAKGDYDQKQFKKAVAEEARRVVEESQSQTNQAQVDREREGAMLAHYERAESSKIPDYEALEDAAISAMGQTLVSEIIVNTDQSHVVLAHLGKHPEKAERYAQIAKQSPVKCLLEIGALARSLKVQRKTPPPADPETTIERGIPATNDPFLKGVRFE